MPMLEKKEYISRGQSTLRSFNLKKERSYASDLVFKVFNSIKGMLQQSIVFSQNDAFLPTSGGFHQ